MGWSLLSPAHILWINLVADTFPALALGVENEERNLMSRAPRGSKAHLLGKAQWFTVGFIGLWEGLITLVVFMIGIKILAARRLLPQCLL